MPVPPSLHRLIYRSQTTSKWTESGLATLLRQARQHNQTVRLSGLLLYAEGAFLQVLEGPEPALSELYARIQADPRHFEVQTLAYETIAARAFPDWRMGFAATDNAFLAQITGFLPLPAAPGLTAHPTAELRKLLRDFAQGRAQDE